MTLSEWAILSLAVLGPLAVALVIVFMERLGRRTTATIGEERPPDEHAPPQGTLGVIAESETLMQKRKNITGMVLGGDNETSSEMQTITHCDKPGRNPLVHWPALLRDTALVWLLTFLGGFAVGLAKLRPAEHQWAITAANLILGGIAFTIVGCLARQNRFRHLMQVALASWLTSLVNIALSRIGVLDWLFGSVFLGLLALIGFGLSSAIMPGLSPRLRVNTMLGTVIVLCLLGSIVTSGYYTETAARQFQAQSTPNTVDKWSKYRIGAVGDTPDILDRAKARSELKHQRKWEEWLLGFLLVGGLCALVLAAQLAMWLISRGVYHVAKAAAEGARDGRASG